ncbi:MAG TPA: hypothetical protein VH560_04495 [Polyangia bacterium]|jgi:hypothetical protein|nr:hypothetical protein [Polyangia bacterium]
MTVTTVRRHFAGNRSTKAMSSARVSVMFVLALAACDGRALEIGGAVDAGSDGDAPAIPDFIGPPVLSCGRGVGVVPLASPCQVGRGPIFEVDCAYGPQADQVIRFMLAVSLFLNGGVETTEPKVTLGAPLIFDATLLPTFAKILANGEGFQLTRMNGFLTLTKASFTDRAFDGWFSHLDFVWTAPGGDTLTCTLDDGRFSTIAGAYE